MNSNITKHFGLILASIAAIGSELLNGAGGEPADNSGTPAPGGEEKPRGRGRPPKADSTAPAGDGGTGATAPTGGMTFEQIKALIAPLIEEERGAEVKKVIAKYTGDDSGSKGLSLLPQHHAAFKKDIEALSI